MGEPKDARLGSSRCAARVFGGSWCVCMQDRAQWRSVVFLWTIERFSRYTSPAQRIDRGAKSFPWQRLDIASLRVVRPQKLGRGTLETSKLSLATRCTRLVSGSGCCTGCCASRIVGRTYSASSFATLATNVQHPRRTVLPTRGRITGALRGVITAQSQAGLRACLAVVRERFFRVPWRLWW